jgi:uncharacterized protein (UPF0179 family)
MSDQMRASIIDVLLSVQEIIEGTYGHDDAGERDEADCPDNSAADTVELLCGLEIAIDEALEALQPCATP